MSIYVFWRYGILESIIILIVVYNIVDIVEFWNWFFNYKFY